MVIGQKISHYRILEKLGEGGMGVVYLACDIALDRQVALKILRPEHCASAERKKRFIQEARTASSLNHPNIVGIYEVDSVDGVEFIAMEWVDGIPMDRLIRPGGLPRPQGVKTGPRGR